MFSFRKFAGLLMAVVSLVSGVFAQDPLPDNAYIFVASDVLTTIYSEPDVAIYIFSPDAGLSKLYPARAGEAADALFSVPLNYSDIRNYVSAFAIREQRLRYLELPVGSYEFAPYLIDDDTTVPAQAIELEAGEYYFLTIQSGEMSIITSAEKWADTGAEDGTIYTWRNDWDNGPLIDVFVNDELVVSGFGESETIHLALPTGDVMLQFNEAGTNTNLYKTRVGAAPYTFSGMSFSHMHDGCCISYSPGDKFPLYTYLTTKGWLFIQSRETGSAFYDALEEHNIFDVMDEHSTYTLLVPDDAAFAAVASTLTSEQMATYLRHYVIKATFDLSEMTSGTVREFQSLADSLLKLTIMFPGHNINGAELESIYSGFKTRDGGNIYRLKAALPFPAQ